MRAPLAALLFLALATAGPAHGQDPATVKRAEIEKLLELTGSLDIGKQMSVAMVQQMSSVLRAANPDLPAKAFQVIEEEVNGVIADHLAGFRELMIGVYDRHYTLVDVQGLNRFYASDLGRKVTRTLPTVLQESMLAGRTWGQSLGPEVQRRIEARFRKENIDT